MIPAPRSILIVNIRLIGDVILTTPLIGLLKGAFPEAAIDLLVARGTGEFLERDPRVRRVLYAHTGSKTERQRNTYQREIFGQYDLAITMNASDRGTIAVLLAGRKSRVGFYDQGRFWKGVWKRLLLTHPLPLPEDVPVARHCRAVAQALEIPHERLTVKVYWDESDEAMVRGILDERGVADHFFVLHPFARWIYKFWSFERFAAVSDQIVERYGLHPVWTSSPSRDEKAQLATAAGLCRHRPTIIAGELDLNQMTCLLGKAKLYVGLDTAVTHLAASTGVPLVALYGPTFTTRWFPWCNNAPDDQASPSTRGLLQRGQIVVVQKDLACVPCGKAGCNDDGLSPSPCLQEISVEEVLAAVDASLATGKEKGIPL
ncbi:glycosyltransferase family 9 protein [Geobacter sp. SVR]|uniref:glycosyltransferase family 9 protein n=1 Tax=Geobacter sp. SVR TaxID=2495594 RepID=UPI00143F0569|nr:glycosyltransferase family 9 protein [Geobacter sp. SVR]BCS52417.1 putative lipopolysaccharide heptosyltransferase III [Geobacter sp. SVR]GCF87352.1 putative lipopolysaccharide heptosyltransferase III [Geobacter sp. SVR]